MTGGNKQRLQMRARGAESVTEDGVAGPGVPEGGRECARRRLRAGWMDRIRLLWSPGSLTLWPIPSGGGPARAGMRCRRRGRWLGGALLAGQTAEEGQGSGPSQGQTDKVVTSTSRLSWPWQSRCLPSQPALEQDKRHSTLLLFGTGAQPDGPFMHFSPFPPRVP